MSKETATIRDVISYCPVLTLGGGETVKTALRLMESNQRHAIGVLDGKAFSGMFTRGDLIHNVISRGLDPLQTIVADVMTIDPITIHPECGLLEAFFILCRNNISHLPVIEKNRFIGIVSDDDLRLKISNDLRQLKKDHNLLLSYVGGAYSATGNA